MTRFMQNHFNQQLATNKAVSITGLAKQDIKDIAESILVERSSSLQKEVRHCISRYEKTQEMAAPFSALLYCFSTIDLLGSLYAGKFNKGNTKTTKIYMKDLIHYTDFQILLLQEIFRHKLVHTAEPKWLYEKNGECYTWSCYADKRSEHLKCIVVDKEARANNFSISIWSLVEDIVNSIHGTNGYLNMVMSNQNNCFDKFSKVFNKLSGA